MCLYKLCMQTYAHQFSLWNGCSLSKLALTLSFPGPVSSESTLLFRQSAYTEKSFCTIPSNYFPLMLGEK